MVVFLLEQENSGKTTQKIVCKVFKWIQNQKDQHRVVCQCVANYFLKTKFMKTKLEDVFGNVLVEKQEDLKSSSQWKITKMLQLTKNQQEFQESSSISSVKQTKRVLHALKVKSTKLKSRVHLYICSVKRQSLAQFSRMRGFLSQKNQSLSCHLAQC